MKRTEAGFFTNIKSPSPDYYIVQYQEAFNIGPGYFSAIPLTSASLGWREYSAIEAS
jgi:hypothetical protein